MWENTECERTPIPPHRVACLRIRLELLRGLRGHRFVVDPSYRYERLEGKYDGGGNRREWSTIDIELWLADPAGGVPAARV